MYCSFFISFGNKCFVIKQKGGNYYSIANKEVNLNPAVQALKKEFFLKIVREHMNSRLDRELTLKPKMKILFYETWDLFVSVCVRKLIIFLKIPLKNSHL